MAVPKRKSSKARKNKRRSNVWKLAAPGFCKCPQCGELWLLQGPGSCPDGGLSKT